MIARIAQIVSTTAALLVLCSACAVAPEDQTEGTENAPPPAVETDDVATAAFNTSGGTAPKPTCSQQCDNWCTYKNGRWICGTSCICIVQPSCTCPMALAP